jgi:hypothetical protein
MNVTDEIQHKRNVIHNGVFTARNEFLKRLRASKPLCATGSKQCDALIMGSLHRKMAIKHEDFTKPLTSFLELTPADVLMGQGHDRCMGAVLGLLAHLKKDIKKALDADLGKANSEDEDAIIKEEPESPETVLAAAAGTTMTEVTQYKKPGTEVDKCKIEAIEVALEDKKTELTVKKSEPEVVESPVLETAASAPIPSRSTVTSPTLGVPPHLRNTYRLKGSAPPFRRDPGYFVGDMSGDRAGAGPRTGSHPLSNIVTALDDPARKQLVKHFKDSFPGLDLKVVVDAFIRGNWVPEKAADILFNAGLIPGGN